ncbi:hypothetical protein JCM19046_4073 [Bacillus sp. JCM 19046]|nr:hypothetical protein JCM19045_2838 [Bacillus sp. JCM 19045]GAF19424.1 hypothetical protein JCM19046_4073 [Bacillus sp. JCM 19046]
MVRSLRYDRIVESSIHARVQPTHIGTVDRVSRPVRTQATRAHVSENDLIAYGYALTKENRILKSQPKNEANDHPLTAFKRLSIHSKTAPLYNYITGKFPSIFHSSNHEDTRQTIIEPDKLKQLGSTLHLNQRSDALIEQPLKGLAIDHYA